MSTYLICGEDDHMGFVAFEVAFPGVVNESGQNAHVASVDAENIA